MIRATWYLESYISYHLANDHSLFVGKIQSKVWDFTTAGGQIICSKGVGMVSIALADGSNINLNGVALVSDYKSNLISLSQLQKNRITYHNTNSYILLMQDGVPITYARRDQNLFILDFAVLRKIMQTNIANLTYVKTLHALMATRKNRPMHLVSRNKKVRV